MKKFNKVKVLISIITVIFLIFTGCSKIQEDQQEEKQQDQTENEVIYAQDFELETLEGETIKLSDLKGKKVFINFWATWCTYCEKEMPDFQKFYDKYKDEGFILLGVDVGESKSKVQKFVDDINIDFPILLDTDSQTARNYGIRSFPTTIAVNEEGIVVVAKIGMMTYEDMESMYSRFEDKN